MPIVTNRPPGYRVEAGVYNPTVGTLTRIAKALGVPVRELLG
jgi:transcriptional regulator with XRE-family HTH domain